MKSYRETGASRLDDGAMRGGWWQAAEVGDRVVCKLCPRECSLKPGDRGFCFVRENRDGAVVLSTYGKSTGFCIDPIEKKPLNHFYPGTPVLSFGTAGCNLGCKFCQNWDISKSREVQRLSAGAEPESIAMAAAQNGCASVAYTYNDPVIWAEYAIDTARECRRAGVKNVAVTAGYLAAEARAEFFEFMDAANVDLKAFTEDFYHKVTYSHLEPVLDTLTFLKHETDVWLEITNLIIPDLNDSPGELRRMCSWILQAIGEDVPVHFTAFHPDFRMTDRGRTPPETLQRAREIALAEGVRHAYVGNVNDAARQSTYCHHCQQLLIERDWYQLGVYNLDASGRCTSCQTLLPGRFGVAPGDWGAKRQPIKIDLYRATTTVANNEIARVVTTENTSVPELHRIRVPAKKETTMASETSTPNAISEPTSASAPATPQPLKLEKLSDDLKRAITQASANWIAQVVHNEPLTPAADALGAKATSIVMGAFVTLKRGDVLRGCCGVLGKPMPLSGAVASAAMKTVKEDQRMAAIAAVELPYLNMDVTLLGPFKPVTAEGAARAAAVEIGKQGLMIQRGDKSGLLLPSVATERGWDAVQFLRAVCSKAGLPISAWESPEVKLFTFDGVSFGGKLSELLPLNLPTSKNSPLTKEQLAEYAKVAGQNIAAMVTGGTPSYVLPHLPDATVNGIVLSMQWNTTPNAGEQQVAATDGPSASGKNLQQGNALQVSFRPGVPLQSTLYQMCQQAANMFLRQRFAGQLQIGLTVGFDPAMHGYGAKADLEGIDPATRALVLSDPRHCGFVFQPDRTAQEQLELLRGAMPIGTRDASVHSMQVLSTMPSVISVAAPVPVAASGQRPAAVAGQFYPAEDAARRAMIGTLMKSEEPPKCSPLAIMVPHAGIKYSGKIAASVWRRLDAPESRTMVVISPKHTNGGVNWSVCPFESWQVSPSTSIAGDVEVATKIAEGVQPLSLDAAAHEKEHGIEVQLPILERLAPKCKVVGLALHGGSWADIQAAAAEFAAVLKSLPEMPLLVISSDMNHYAPEDENRRRDTLALEALAIGDPQKLIDVCSANEVSMCGLVPAAFVLETLKQLGHNVRVEQVGYTTSAEVTGDKSAVVGYAGALILSS